MMIPGWNELRAARVLLTEDLPRSQLLTAAERVWSAMFYIEEWPQPLQQRAKSLEPILFRYGTIRMTLGRMDEWEAATMRRELLAVIELADAVAMQGANCPSFGGAIEQGTGAFDEWNGSRKLP